MKYFKIILTIFTEINFSLLSLYIFYYNGKIDYTIITICDFALLGLQFALLVILFIDDNKNEKTKIKELSQKVEVLLDEKNNLSAQEIKDIFKSYANAMVDI